MNEPARGKLGWRCRAGGSDEPWKLVPIADIGSIHRLRWGDIDGDTKLDLVVAPIFGREAKPPGYDGKATHPGLSASGRSEDGKLDVDAARSSIR